jgi:hypothetical protein
MRQEKVEHSVLMVVEGRKRFVIFTIELGIHVIAIIVLNNRINVLLTKKVINQFLFLKIIYGNQM